MMQWVIGSIPRDEPIELCVIDWCNKGCGMCNPVWDNAYKRSLAASLKA